MNYENELFIPILECIEDNTESLMKKENAPVLAKIAYLLRVSHYAGRVCYGFGGLIENNPSILNDSLTNIIEERFGILSEIALAIYNALIISSPKTTANGFEASLMEYLETMNCEKKYNQREKLEFKPQKTFDEWINVLGTEMTMESIYYYLIAGRNTNGFEYVNGFVEKTSNPPYYAYWQNVALPPHIENFLEPIINSNILFMAIAIAEAKNKEREMIQKAAMCNFANAKKSYEFLQRFDRKVGMTKIHLTHFCKGTVASFFDENTHISYLRAAITAYEIVFKDLGVNAGTAVDKSHYDNYQRIKGLVKVCESKSILAH